MKTYTNIDGSIFYGDKQLMVIVAVDCRPSLRNRVADIVVRHLNKEKQHAQKEKRHTSAA